MLKSYLQAAAIATAHGYRIGTYQEAAKTERELQLLLSVSEYGFIYCDSRKIFINADQPDEEIIFTIWHEVGHIVLNTDDETAADDYARKMTA